MVILVVAKSLKPAPRFACSVQPFDPEDACPEEISEWMLQLHDGRELMLVFDEDAALDPENEHARELAMETAHDLFHGYRGEKVELRGRILDRVGDAPASHFVVDIDHALGQLLKVSAKLRVRLACM